MENATDVKIEKSVRPYIARLFPVTDILTVVFLICYAAFVYSKQQHGLSEYGQFNYFTFMSIFLPIVLAISWYYYTYLPAQYCITGIHTKDKYIYFTACYRDGIPEEKKYNFKDVKISYRPGRYNNFFIRFKVIPEGQLADFKTKYVIRNQKGWTRKEAEKLVDDLKNWKEHLQLANPYN